MKALDNYNQAVYQLADELLRIRNKIGRNNLLKSMKMSSNKVDWLLIIAGIKDRPPTLTPEHVYEVGSVKNKAKWLERAELNGWTPVQLRKEIRQSSKVYSEDSMSFKTSSISKNLMLAEIALKRSTDRVQKAKALEMLGRIIKTVNL